MFWVPASAKARSKGEKSSLQLHLPYLASLPLVLPEKLPQFLPGWRRLRLVPSSKSTQRSREHPEGLVRLSRVCQAGPQLQLSSSTPPAGPADPRQCEQSSCLPSITPPLLPQGSGKSQGKIIQRNRLVSSSPALPPRRSWGLPTQHLLYFEDARRRAGYRQGSQFCSLEMPKFEHAREGCPHASWAGEGLWLPLVSAPRTTQD